MARATVFCLVVVAVCLSSALAARSSRHGLAPMSAPGSASSAADARLATAASRLCQRLDVALARGVLSYSAGVRFEVVVDIVHVMRGASREHVKAWDIHMWPAGAGRVRYSAAEPREVREASRRHVSHRSSPFSRFASRAKNEQMMAFRYMHSATDETAYLALKGQSGSSSATIVFTTCGPLLPSTAFVAWYQDRCYEGLGTHTNVSTKGLWPGGRCSDFATHCSALWSYAAPAHDPGMPCWDDVLYTASARLSPGGQRLVIHSMAVSADYLWEFGEGRAPKILQELRPVCPNQNSEVYELVDGSCASFSDDGALYITWNMTHLLLFHTGTGEPALQLLLDEPRREDVGVPYFSALRTVELRTAPAL